MTTKTNVLLVNPQLAAEIGLNEAMILHQIHYWCEKNKGDKLHYHKGRWWTFNTYREWQEQFPFWGKNTIVRAIERLEKRGLLISDNFNKMKYDRTKWYTIDYDKLEKYLSQIGTTLNPSRDEVLTHYEIKQNPDGGKPIPENTAKNTQREYSPPLVSDDKEEERVGYGEYGWVRLTEDEIISLIIDYGEQAADRAIIYIDTLAQQTGNRNGWHDWLLTCKRAIHENWGGIMNGLR